MMKKRIWLCVACLTILLTACVKNQTQHTRLTEAVPASSPNLELPPEESESSLSPENIAPTKTTNQTVEETVFHSESGDNIRHSNAADENAVPFEKNLNSLAGVSMEAVVGSANAASVKLLLKNDTDLDILYGDSYEIQRYYDGLWISVPYIIDNWAFQDIAYSLKKNLPHEIRVDWQVFHGELEPGSYRIIKKISDFRGTGDFTEYFLGAEFEIKAD